MRLKHQTKAAAAADGPIEVRWHLSLFGDCAEEDLRIINDWFLLPVYEEGSPERDYYQEKAYRAILSIWRRFVETGNAGPLRRLIAARERFDERPVDPVRFFLLSALLLKQKQERLLEQNEAKEVKLTPKELKRLKEDLSRSQNPMTLRELWDWYSACRNPAVTQPHLRRICKEIGYPIKPAKRGRKRSA